MEDQSIRGGALWLAIIAAFLVAASLGAAALTSASSAQRERATERALAQAREALLAYAADRPIDADVGPGYLPCPDQDDDGWAEPVCGSLSGHLGQAERLGRLPWKTLGLPDLRDGHGERLWYAVSTRYKGLLNCAASTACVDMTPDAAAGTITLRSPFGDLLHDGTRADGSATAGAAAVVIAPGPPLVRADGRVQRRDCVPGARCDPRDYLDSSPAEDNAAFLDRSDAAGRAANADGFIAGPLFAQGRLVVNDRIAAISHSDVMARVMGRVAVEIAHCVRLKAPSPAVPPLPEPNCATPELGSLPDEALASEGCNASADRGWWIPWKPHVLYARGASGGIAVQDESGRTLAAGRRFAVLVTRSARSCGEGRVTCDAAGCTTAVSTPANPDRYDALAASP